jgi:uncharacterized RDD family membrane protein YckC
MDNERLIAHKYKRISAFLVDVIWVFLLWCFMTNTDLKQVDTLMESLDPTIEGSLDVFIKALFQMLTAFLLKWLFCQTLYYCVLPAIIGNGKTIGKLILRISLVEVATLEEMSPSRLMLREFVGRTLLETLFVIPGIISLFMVLFSKDGKSLRDRLANTIIVQDTSYLG